MDPTSQANYHQVATEHILLKWNVDFEQKLISGSSTHDLKVLEDNVGVVMFVAPRSFDRKFLTAFQFRYFGLGHSECNC